jgi:hypothetical protein
VSADRLPIAVSERLDRAMTDQLAAIASGVVSLSQGAARHSGAGLITHTVVEMQRERSGASAWHGQPLGERLPSSELPDTTARPYKCGRAGSQEGEPCAKSL